MACYFPRDGYLSTFKSSKGKRLITIKSQEAISHIPVTKVACGGCIGCRLEESKQWAVRAHHESLLYEENCFITLTYDNQNLPLNKGIDVEHTKTFMKDLREHVRYHTGKTGIRSFGCGEYGEKCKNCGKNKLDCNQSGQNCWLPVLGRPHYHACIFNYDFPDKYEFFKKKNITHYRSPLLEEIWGKGHCTVTDFNFKTAAYVARYVTKKLKGQKRNEIDPETGLGYYDWTCEETGITYEREPERKLMLSRNPGIGAPWFEKYGKQECYPHDEICVDKKKMKPPKYYDYLMEKTDEEVIEKVKEKRREKAKESYKFNTDQNLEREKKKKRQVDKLHRTL